jgi:hypothetical protein
MAQERLASILRCKTANKSMPQHCQCTDDGLHAAYARPSVRTVGIRERSISWSLFASVCRDTTHIVCKVANNFEWLGSFEGRIRFLAGGDVCQAVPTLPLALSHWHCLPGTAIFLVPRGPVGHLRACQIRPRQKLSCRTGWACYDVEDTLHPVSLLLGGDTLNLTGQTSTQSCGHSSHGPEIGQVDRQIYKFPHLYDAQKFV